MQFVNILYAYYVKICTMNVRLLDLEPRKSFVLRNEQEQESAQTTKGAYKEVRDRGVRKLDELLRSL